MVDAGVSSLPNKFDPIAAPDRTATPRMSRWMRHLPRIIVLPADVSNSALDTLADVTGLAFPVLAGNTYWFRFLILYTAAATTTGARFSINGPAFDLLGYRSQWTLDATTTQIANHASYDQPAAAGASSRATGNIAQIEGIITPSAAGNVIARFASEVSGSAIVAKAGSMVQFARTL